MKNKKIVSVLVKNNAGVLARVSFMFCQRGFNIDSLTVSETNEPDISRITIVTHGDESSFDQIIKQTGKLQEANAVFPLEPENAIMRELLLVKIAVDDTNRRALKEIAEIYKAKIVDLSIGSMVMELTGEPNKINGFIDILDQYKIIEMCRTGITAIERGTPRA